MSVCRGCGAVLQTTDPHQTGYTPKADALYCQRCFRLMHYDDLTLSMRTGIDPDAVMDRIEKMDVLILWVVDLFDFEAGMIPGLSRKLVGKDILLVLTKKDLLPETVSPEKAARFAFGRLKEEGIHVKHLILTGRGESNDGTLEIKEAVGKMAHGRPIVVMGRANSGKSTLLNALMGEKVLTMSRYPGTTLDFNELEIDGQKYIDTPGIEIGASMLMNVKEKDLKTILPDRTIKPGIYQVYSDQSFAIGGLARIDVTGCKKAVCTFYLSSRLNVHRSKADAAQQLWKKHYGELLSPVPLGKNFISHSIHKNQNKIDAVIEGLGWCCISGDASTITVYAPEKVNVIFRKAML